MSKDNKRDYAVLEAADGRCEAVVRGWSWSAALFQGLWAWRVGVLGSWLGAFLLVGPAFLGARYIDSPRLRQTVWLFAGVWLLRATGKHGNAWRAQRLEKEGFQLRRIVAAGGATEAIAVYRAELEGEASAASQTTSSISASNLSPASAPPPLPSLNRQVAPPQDNELPPPLEGGGASSVNGPEENAGTDEDLSVPRQRRRIVEF